MLVGGRALYWPRERALLVADLHLEKASFYARARPDAAALRQPRNAGAGGAGDPRDRGAAGLHAGRQLPRSGRPRAARAARGGDARGADPGGRLGVDHRQPRRGDGGDAPGGTLAEELDIAGFVLRHRALRGETRPELSGPFPPAPAAHRARGGAIRRPCAVVAVVGAAAGG